jgi:hypothetical protein
MPESNVARSERWLLRMGGVDDISLPPATPFGDTGGAINFLS